MVYNHWSKINTQKIEIYFYFLKNTYMLKIKKDQIYQFFTKNIKLLWGFALESHQEIIG